jgi:hypothetical protein
MKYLISFELTVPFEFANQLNTALSVHSLADDATARGSARRDVEGTDNVT